MEPEEVQTIFARLTNHQWYVSQASPESRRLKLSVGDIVPDSYEGTITLDDTAMSGEQVRAFRESKGLSVEQFARAYGLTVSQVERMEREGMK